jgi:hypothetical protein
VSVTVELCQAAPVLVNRSVIDFGGQAFPGKFRSLAQLDFDIQTVSGILSG